MVFLVLVVVLSLSLLALGALAWIARILLAAVFGDISPVFAVGVAIGLGGFRIAPMALAAITGWIERQENERFFTFIHQFRQRVAQRSATEFDAGSGWVDEADRSRGLGTCVKMGGAEADWSREAHALDVLELPRSASIGTITRRFRSQTNRFRSDAVARFGEVAARIGAVRRKAITDAHDVLIHGRRP